MILFTSSLSGGGSEPESNAGSTRLVAKSSARICARLSSLADTCLATKRMMTAVAFVKYAMCKYCLTSAVSVVARPPNNDVMSDTRWMNSTPDLILSVTSSGLNLKIVSAAATFSSSSDNS